MDDKQCFSCRYAGMDMDMTPYCAHPAVLQINEFGINVNVVRGAAYAVGRLGYGLCGPEGTLYASRDQED